MDLAGRRGVNVLCVNAGSSSIKVALRRPEADGVIVSGAVDGIGQPESRLRLANGDGVVLVDESHVRRTHADALRLILEALDDLGMPSLAGVGHRVVHGGRRFVTPTLIDTTVRRALDDLVHLAPLHLPAQIAAIAAVTAIDASLPQVACFDTAFHRRMPEISQRFPLPEWAWDEGICRFGFHGLSYEYITGVLGPNCGRVVIAHLGNGASMAAVHDGCPVDTTMAYTPTAGLMMGTRTGDLDPGVLIALTRERGMDAEALERLVNGESGLLGVSGSSADMRVLLEVRDQEPRADRAIAMFCRTAKKFVGALAATLGGIDQLVFTGGIGEHAPAVRAEICEGLDYLGIRLAPDRNNRDALEIGAEGTGCVVRIVPTDENQVIARQTAALLV